MATLTVNGTKITVDDAFLSLPKAQQEATVNEIAAQLGVKAAPSAVASAPGGQGEAQAFADRYQNPMSKDFGMYSPQNDTGNPLDRLMAGFTSGINSIPIAGPAIMGGLENLKAGFHGVSPETIKAEDQAWQSANPQASMVGGVAGSVAPYAIAGAYAVPARILGLTGANLPTTATLGQKGLDLATRSLAAFGSNEAIGTADSMARGSDFGSAVRDNLGPSAIIGGLPLAGAVARQTAKAAPKAFNWATGNVLPMLRDSLNPAKAAQKGVGRAGAADAGQMMTPAEEALAAANNLDIRNIDRGGPATRRLARIAKSSSPEAESALVGAVDRGAPGVDTANFLAKLVGGSADDLALRQGLQDTAKLVNGPAYKKAFANPNARAVWNDPIKELFQSPAFLSAVKDAERTGADAAAVAGGKAVRNPFEFRSDGTVTLKRNADGSTALPSLEFWNQVKINLDTMIGQAQRSGGDYRILTQMKQKLVGALDSAVPEYKAARAGAAAFFGAEDMIDAGKQFALAPRNLPEAKAVIAKLNSVDRKAFEIGAASSAIDLLKSKDTFASIKQAFNNPASREFWQSLLGPGRADQLEAFVKVQGIMEESKRAVLGGSQTHDLLMGSGLMGGGYAANQMAPGNPLSTAAYILGAARLFRGTAGKYVDRKILTEVANLLASGDKAALNKVIANATMSPKWRAALDGLMTAMHATARGAVVAGTSAAPLEITVNGGAN